MHDEEVKNTPESQKEINKLHTQSSLLLLCVAVMSILLGMGLGNFCKMDTISKSDDAAEKTAILKEIDLEDKVNEKEKEFIKKVSEEEKKSKTDEKEADSHHAEKEKSSEKSKTSQKSSKFPTYEVTLYEEPLISMWEFNHAVTERDAAAIGRFVSSFNDDNTNYSIVFLKEKSLISENYNYFIAIKGDWIEASMCIKVTAVTIDDVWNTLLANVEEWNTMVNNEKYSPENNNKFDALMKYLQDCTEDYVMKEIPARAFVVHGELLTPVS